MIKSGAWARSSTYSGTFDFYWTADSQAGTFVCYIQTSAEGLDSCVWTNRSNCVNFGTAYSIYREAPTAPSNLTFSASPFENAVRLSWSGGADGMNNPLIAYHCYYSVNGGAETGVNAGMNLYCDIDTSAWARGSSLVFHVASIANYIGNPFSAWSAAAYKNRVPNTVTGAALSKLFYVPGETMRVTFTNNGDPDGNAAGFEAAAGAGETIAGTNASGAATYVDIATAGWTAGVSYTVRVRPYDAFGVRGAWSAYTAAALLGLPMKIAAGAGSPGRQVCAMKIAAEKGSVNRAVKSMKIAACKGLIDRKVF